MSIFIEIVKTQEDLDAILNLRSAVFIDEQLVPEEEEIDDLDTLQSIVDDQVIHIIAKEHNQVLGTARMFVENRSAISSSQETDLHIGRVAVRYDARKTDSLSASASVRVLRKIRLPSTRQDIFRRRDRTPRHGHPSLWITGVTFL